MNIEKQYHDNHHPTTEWWESIGGLAPSQAGAIGIILGALGRQVPQSIIVENLATNESDRLMALRLGLLDLQLDTGDPKWSSTILLRMLNEYINKLHGSVSEVVNAVYDILYEYQVPLLPEVGNLIQEIVTSLFAGHRNQFTSANFSGMAKLANAGILLPAVALLFLRSIPPDALTPSGTVHILRGLAETDYWKAALCELDEDLKAPESIRLLSEWAANLPDVPYRDDIISLLSSDTSHA